LPPLMSGSQVVCPHCFDVVARRSLVEAIKEWNAMQEQIANAQSAPQHKPTP
jgi:hypothetical protein